MNLPQQHHSTQTQNTGPNQKKTTDRLEKTTESKQHLIWEKDSPHRICQPLVSDFSRDAQMTLRVHGAKLQRRGAWWRLVTQICSFLVLRVHLANLATALLPLLICSS